MRTWTVRRLIRMKAEWAVGSSGARIAQISERLVVQFGRALVRSLDCVSYGECAR